MERVEVWRNGEKSEMARATRYESRGYPVSRLQRAFSPSDRESSRRTSAEPALSGCFSGPSLNLESGKLRERETGDGEERDQCRYMFVCIPKLMKNASQQSFARAARIISFLPLSFVLVGFIFYSFVPFTRSRSCVRGINVMWRVESNSPDPNF